jgi:hypothetical protein
VVLIYNIDVSEPLDGLCDRGFQWLSLLGVDCNGMDALGIGIDDVAKALDMTGSQRGHIVTSFGDRSGQS